MNRALPRAGWGVEDPPVADTRPLRPVRRVEQTDEGVLTGQAHLIGSVSGIGLILSRAPKFRKQVAEVHGSRTHLRPGSWPSNRFEDGTDLVPTFLLVVHSMTGEFKCGSRVRCVAPRYPTVFRRSAANLAANRAHRRNRRPDSTHPLDCRAAPIGLNGQTGRTHLQRRGIDSSKDLPYTVTISAGQTTRLDSSIDTGIR